VDEPVVRRGVAFLEGAQNADGGFGEACQSYDVDAFVRSASCASQTAWGVMGLLAAGRVGSEAVRRGIAWLLSHQERGGNWAESHFTGTGFPGHFYIRYHLYRDCFPMMALARYAQELGSKRRGRAEGMEMPTLASVQVVVGG
jgi:squalene-hopene/tetraprenyl-beta-curcumene cyclase